MALGGFSKLAKFELSMTVASCGLITCESAYVPKEGNMLISIRGYVPIEEGEGDPVTKTLRPAVSKALGTELGHLRPLQHFTAHYASRSAQLGLCLSHTYMQIGGN